MIGAKIVRAALQDTAFLSQAPSSERDAVKRWMTSLRPPWGDNQHGAGLNKIQLSQPGVALTRAERLGSPITSGVLGNGPGVGTSGAGTQQNFRGRGLS